jgi:ABC-type multidrug transport system fused ATPase/permease subunit
VLRDLWRTVDVDNTIITHDAGSPRDQLSPFWVSRTPLSYLGWGKTTQLGYGLGLAMGAKLAAPDKLCINVWGDAAIGFTGMDFETAGWRQSISPPSSVTSARISGSEHRHPSWRERLRIEDGEFVVLVGPSGCGKSTLLRMIAGLENITGGEIAIGGRVVNTSRRRTATSPWCSRTTRSIRT